MCVLLIVFVHVCVRVCVYKCVCARMGQAPWKQQQRSSAFKWIKTPAQSPGPAGIGQTGCSLDEDLRLIISHAAFVFAATVACMGDTVQYMEICMLYILAVIWVLAIQSANQCCCIFTICVESFAEFRPSLTLNISCYQLCRAAAVERFLSSECIPAECLCLVCRHAACLIYAIICELLLWFPRYPACHSHTSCSVSAPINQVNISVLQLLQS